MITGQAHQGQFNENFADIEEVNEDSDSVRHQENSVSHREEAGADKVQMT